MHQQEVTPRLVKCIMGNPWPTDVLLWEHRVLHIVLLLGMDDDVTLLVMRTLSELGGFCQLETAPRPVALELVSIYGQFPQRQGSVQCPGVLWHT